jgi:hypothetical protein
VEKVDDAVHDSGVVPAASADQRPLPDLIGADDGSREPERPFAATSRAAEVVDC